MILKTLLKSMILATTAVHAAPHPSAVEMVNSTDTGSAFPPVDTVNIAKEVSPLPDGFQAMSGCVQATCPDHSKPYDFFQIRSIYGAFGFVRANRCGQCTRNLVDWAGGCAAFDSCDLGKYDVCMDLRNRRGHMKPQNSDKKTCFSIVEEFHPNCLTTGNQLAQVSVWRPYLPVVCEW